MTQSELDALPDISPTFGYIDAEIDGKRTHIPTMDTEPVALFQKDDDGVVIDACGMKWLLGWVNGVRVKRRVT